MVETILIYWQPRTLQIRSQSKKKAECPRCKRLFKRLDAHLRVSATCKDVNPTPPPTTAASAEASCGHHDEETGRDAMFFSPLNSNPAAASDATALTTTTTNTSPYPDPQIKASLNLPTTAEGWRQPTLTSIPPWSQQCWVFTPQRRCE